jgi:hypothetical protein
MHHQSENHGDEDNGNGDEDVEQHGVVDTRLGQSENERVDSLFASRAGCRARAIVDPRRSSARYSFVATHAVLKDL